MELCMEFQADVETDEVYAQLTLQPLTPVMIYSVCLLWKFENCYGFELFMDIVYWMELLIFFILASTARTERYISSHGVGNSKQAADKLLLQDIDS